MGDTYGTRYVCDEDRRFDFGARNNLLLCGVWTAGPVVMG